MRFRTRIFSYLTLGILVLIGLLYKEQQHETVEIPTEKIQHDIIHVSTMTPKIFQESSSKVEKSLTIGQPLLPKVTKSTTESIEEKAVIKAFFGPNMTKEAVKEWQMQHVTGMYVTNQFDL